MKKMRKWKLSAAAILFLISAMCMQWGNRTETAAAGETVALTVGREIYYGTYSTNYFDADGKTAYCLEPLKDTPDPGQYAVVPLDGGAVRKGLYYVYGGPGYAVYQERFGSIGIGGRYSEDDQYCMSHCILSYLYSGNETAFTGLDSSAVAELRTAAERIAGLPDPPEAFYAFLFNTGGSGQVMGGSGSDRTGGIEIRKRSDHPEWTEGNPSYSLGGAVFGIYRPGEELPSWEVTTDENGYASLSDIPIGSYEIAEIKSPPGFSGEGGRREIHVDENSVYTYECVNTAAYYPAGILLKKTDAETGENTPQGAGSLEGAEFEVKYYHGYYDSDPGEMSLLPERTWTFRTNADGELCFTEESKTGGDGFYTNGAGENVLPLGTVTIREVKAPEGYLLNENIYVEKIRQEGSGPADTVYHAPEVPEQIIRGDLQLVKFREDEDENQDQKTSLEGIVFTVASKTTGEEIQIITDENGYASTKGEGGKGGLVYDTYVVREENPPDGLLPVGDFEITVTEEGKTLYYILEDKRIFSPVRLVKKDADSGETVPIAGAEFQLLDENREPVVMTVHYPQETAHSSFKTDETGSFVLPERLSAGIYYFRELNAPAGYLLNKEPVKFEVREDHEWGDPFVVEFSDRPAMGKIHIKKTDEDTGKAVSGAKFEITAKEDILTPAGSVRIPAGSTVGTIVTDENGEGQSDSLYLGRYEIRETEQPQGYVLPEKIYEVGLEYNGQETELVSAEAEITNKPTKITLKKKEEGTETGLKGVKFAVWPKETPEKEKLYITDEEGRIEIKYLAPGTYCVQERESIPGYLRDDAVWEFTVDSTGRIEGQECMEYEVENKKTKIRDTEAFWKETGEKEIYGGEEHVIVDTVIFQNLEPGQVYTLKGALADPETGEILTENGQPIAAVNTFTAEKPSQEIQMEFPVDTVRTEERKIVVFESLYIGDILIATHADPGDKGQTVTILKKPEASAATGDSTVGSLQTAALLAAILLPPVYTAVYFMRKKKM